MTVFQCYIAGPYITPRLNRLTHRTSTIQEESLKEILLTWFKVTDAVSNNSVAVSNE